MIKRIGIIFHKLLHSRRNCSRRHTGILRTSHVPLLRPLFLSLRSNRGRSDYLWSMLPLTEYLGTSLSIRDFSLFLPIALCNSGQPSASLVPISDNVRLSLSPKICSIVAGNFASGSCFVFGLFANCVSLASGLGTLSPMSVQELNTVASAMFGARVETQQTTMPDRRRRRARGRKSRSFEGNNQGAGKARMQKVHGCDGNHHVCAILASYRWAVQHRLDAFVAANAQPCHMGIVGKIPEYTNNGSFAEPGSRL